MAYAINVLGDKEFLEKNPALKKFRADLEKTLQSQGGPLQNLLKNVDQIYEQNRAMMEMVKEVKQAHDDLRTEFNQLVTTTNFSPPGFINHINNSDFSFEQEDYVSGTSYTGDDQDAAEWYARVNTTSTQFTENTTSVQSSESLRNVFRSANNGAITGGTDALTASGSFVAGDVGNTYVVVFGAGPLVGTVRQPLIALVDGFTSGTSVSLNTNASVTVSGAKVLIFPRPSYWDKAQGLGVMGRNWGLAHPLVKNLATPGAVVYGRFQIRRNPDYEGFGSLPSDYKIQMSIWDNTSGQQKTVEGGVWEVNAVPAVASPGSFSRQYILRVDSSSGFFYSDVLTPASVSNQVSVSNIDNINYVQVSWMMFPEARTYTLYRFDSEFSEWRAIAVISNGALAFQDKGGRGGALFTPPVANINAKAQVRINGFAGLLDANRFVDFMFAIRVPSNYVYGNTSNKQWLRIDILDSSDNYATVDAGILFIDKVAVGYNNGKWTMSAKDVATNAPIATTSPPAVDIPGGNDRLPKPGGGERLQSLEESSVS